MWDVRKKLDVPMSPHPAQAPHLHQIPHRIHQIRRPLRMMIPPNQVDLVDTRAIDDVDAGAIDTAGTNAVIDLRRLSEPP